LFIISIIRRIILLHCLLCFHYPVHDCLSFAALWRDNNDVVVPYRCRRIMINTYLPACLPVRSEQLSSRRFESRNWHFVRSYSVLRLAFTYINMVNLCRTLISRCTANCFADNNTVPISWPIYILEFKCYDTSRENCPIQLNF